MISFNVLLCVFYKLSERFNCIPINIALTQFFSATLASLIYSYLVSGFSLNFVTVIIGFIGGIASFGAIYFFLNLIRLGKFSLSVVIINLSLLIPILISIFVFNERPTFLTYIAFILVIMTFFLFYEKDKNKDFNRKKFRWIILATLSMILSGIADSGPKIIEELGLSNISMNYLGYNYFFAFIPTLGVIIKKKSFPSKKEWLLGAGMGVSILFSMFFLVLVLQDNTGITVYPFNKIIVDIIIVLLSFFIWKERLNIKQFFGLLTAVGSVILLNIAL